MRTKMAAVHPGEFLAEILGELGVSQAAFARAAGVSRMRVSHVIDGARPVTADLALLFGKILGQSPQYWLNLRTAYDLAMAQRALGRRLAGLRRLAQVARAARAGVVVHVSQPPEPARTSHTDRAAALRSG